MATRRRDRSQRRHLNPEESFSMGFAELQEKADEDGWAYSDNDPDETTQFQGHAFVVPKNLRSKASS